jgi:EAL domain-containing protein (putative c-di-GMP-specific phosphodiesterase class I)/GGDEF domain-containing protein
MRKTLLNYLLLSEDCDTQQGVELWRISALRILIVVGYSFYVLIAIHSCISALQVGLDVVLPITLAFYFFAGLQLWLSKRYYYYSAYGLLFSIVAAAITINTIIRIPILAMLGPVFVFSLPLVAFILLGAKAGFICMVLNIIPFVALLSGFQLNQYIADHVLLKHANAYVISLIFVFFNICAPLAVARASMAASRLNTKITAQNANLQRQKDLYRTLFIETDVAHLMVCNNHTVIEMNQAAEKLLHCSFKLLSSPVMVSGLFNELLFDDSNEGIVNLTITGKMKTFKVTRSVLLYDGYYFLTIQDVTAKVMLHKTLAAQALLSRQQLVKHSSGLPNRQWLENKLKQRLDDLQNNVCLVAFKINNAQFIQQKFGVQYLALLVKKLAEHWQAKTLNQCHLGSVEIDNLTIITELSSVEAESYLTSFVALLPKHILLNEYKLPLDFKVGIAFSDVKERSPEKLINNALYSVTSSNLAISVYETASLERFIEHQEINVLLNEAIINDELSVVYQPKVKGDGRLIGMEALLRWQSPVIGFVSPSVFIPIAEKSGLVNLVTQWLINHVCQQINTWQKEGLDVVPIAINISGPDLDQEFFHEHLVNTLVEYRIQPQLLELELTESARSLDNSKALATVRYLSNWGFCITLDDFGIGYSGLSKLVSYPVKRVKIDRQFIKQIHMDERKSKVVEAILAMCKVFNIDILAEGVEEFEEVDKLLFLGCTSFQGYVFAKPLNSGRAGELIKSQNVFTYNTNQNITSRPPQAR